MLWFRLNAETLQRQLKKERYRPMPVTGFHVAKRDGSYRPLVRAAAVDTVVQRCLLDDLHAGYDDRFLPESRAWRPGRGVFSALRLPPGRQRSVCDPPGYCQLFRFSRPGCALRVSCGTDPGGAFFGASATPETRKINRRQLRPSLHFQTLEDGGVWLTAEGKRLFLSEYYDKLHARVKVDGVSMSDTEIMREEVRKPVRHFRVGEP